LTLFADEKTTARRTKPIPQLKCIGKACKLYTPDAVQCFNVGGTATDVNWKCEADLPEALRFGRVDVSCEGWSRGGDSYVLKGSCGLEYRLVEIPNHLHNDPTRSKSLWDMGGWSIVDIAYGVLWFTALAVLLYSFLKPCFGGRSNSQTRNRVTPRPPNSGGSWWNSGGNYPPPRQPPPPPYSKDDPTSSSGGWTPGFWTGLGLGGAATYLANSMRQQQPQQPPPRQRQAWDWEHSRFEEPAAPRNPRWAAQGGGEGTSSGSRLGELRRATGVGGSTVR